MATKEDNEKNKQANKMKYILRYTLFFAALIIFLVIGIKILLMGINNYKKETISYAEDNSINYKVYLKENEFFEQPYLGENQIYITSLIDSIDVTFNYAMNYSMPVSGEYKYYVKATISANLANEQIGSYWSKEYILTDEQVGSIANQNDFNINQNIKIDYQKYNELLSLFKKTYGLTTDGNLQIALIVENTVNTENLTKDIISNSSMELNIPLSQLAVEATINTDNGQKTNSVTELVKDNKARYVIYKIIGSILVIFDITEIVTFIYILLKNIKRKSLYLKKLNKILATYDSIIVNVKSMPDISQLKVITVESFEELIDAHSEVRMPINFVEDIEKEESTFLLIANGCVWMCVLSEEDFN